MRKAAALITAMLCFMLTGCAFDMSAGNLLTAPKLSDEQSEIFRALTDSAGNVDLRYPRTGEYLSAFVINDLDHDGTPEAMVFFERHTADAVLNDTAPAGLRIGFLDRESSGSWRSVYEMAADGTEVESVEFSTLGSDTPKAIITYNALNSQEKLISIVGFEDNRPVKISRLTVSRMLIARPDEDRGDMLMTFTRPTQTMPPLFTVYGYNDEEHFTMLYNPITLSREIADYDRITAGKYDMNGTPMFCAAIDFLQAENQYATEMLYYNGKNFVTSDSFMFGGNQTSYIRRQNAYTPKLNSCDINGDGLLDVPMTAVLSGYESLTYPEQVNAVWWLTQKSGEISSAAYTFVAPDKSYIFTFPGRWEGMVTAQIIPEDNTVIFWQAEEDGSREYALTSIRAVDKDKMTDDMRTGLADDNFVLITQSEEKLIYVRNIEYLGLSLTSDEVKAALSVDVPE